MSLDFPTKEQALYSELAIVDALACCISDNCETTKHFKDAILIDHLANATSSLRSAHYRMKKLIKETQESKSVYH